jgi:hypothetical protein
MVKIVTAKCVSLCLFGFLDFIDIPWYISSDEKGTESAAGKKGQDIK